MEGIVEKIESIDTKLPEEIDVTLLVSSISIPQMNPVCNAIKTTPSDNATWDTFHPVFSIKFDHFSTIVLSLLNLTK